MGWEFYAAAAVGGVFGSFLWKWLKKKGYIKWTTR